MLTRFLRRSSCVAQTASHSYDPSWSSQLLNYAPDLVRAFSHRHHVSFRPTPDRGTGDGPLAPCSSFLRNYSEKPSLTTSVLLCFPQRAHLKGVGEQFNITPMRQQNVQIEQMRCFDYNLVGVNKKILSLAPKVFRHYKKLRIYEISCRMGTTPI